MTTIDTEILERAIKEAAEHVKEHGIKILESSKIIDAETAKKELLKVSLTSLNNAFKSTIELYKGTGQDLKQLGSTVGNLGTALASATAMTGKFGRALGLVITATAKISEASLKQTDYLYEANDALSKIGAAGTFTNTELMRFGFNLGLSAPEISKFSNAVKVLGPGLIGLERTTDEGIETFSRLAQTTEEQRRQFLRLGISNDALIENTTFYFDLLYKSGTVLSGRMNDEKALQKNAQDYTKNLIVLSKISGTDIETQKKRQEALKTEYDYVVFQNVETRKINELKNSNIESEREEGLRREKMLETQLNTIDTIAAVDVNIARGLKQLLTTGGIVTGENAFVIQQFSDKVRKDFLKGEETTFNLVKEAQDSIKRFTNMFKTTLTLPGGEEFGKKFGLFADAIRGFTAIDVYSFKNIKELREALEAESKKLGPRDSIVASLQNLRMRINEFVDTFSSPTLTAISVALNGLESSVTGVLNVFSDLGDFLKQITGRGTGDTKTGTIKYPPPSSGPSSKYDLPPARLPRISTDSTPPVARSGGRQSGTNMPVVARIPNGRLPNVDDNAGSLTYDEKVRKYIRFAGGLTGNEENFRKLDPDLRDRFLEAAEKYYIKEKQPMIMTSGFRTLEEQKILYEDKKNNKNLVAEPGKSLHEKGLAFDVLYPELYRKFLVDANLEMPFPKTDAPHVQLPRPVLGDGPQNAQTSGTSFDETKLVKAIDNMASTLTGKMQVMISALDTISNTQYRILQNAQS